jgi:hypothetical protein
VTISLAATGGSAQAAPADRGAGWLSHQLTDGVVVGSYEDLPEHPGTFIDYNDYGLSIDTAFALKAIGGHGSDVSAVRDAVAGDLGSYIGTGGEKYAGAIAKSLVLAESSGGDPENFGGVNLVRRHNGLVTKSGPAKGRIADDSQFGDFANALGQILTVRGLTAAGSGQAGPARRFLLEQQCDQGFFRLTFSKPNAVNQSCGKNSAPDPDATSYAVVQLWRTSKGNGPLRAALKRAAIWLAKQQRSNGAFDGGTSTDAPNTNSTGLASWALALTRHCAAAKAGSAWVASLQVGAQPNGSPLAGQRGAVAYNRAALKAGEQDGIPNDGAVQDQWRRASSQAVPALQFRHGC